MTPCLRVLLLVVYFWPAIGLALSKQSQFNNWYYKNIIPNPKFRDSFFKSDDPVEKNIERIQKYFHRYSSMEFALPSLRFGVLINNANYHIYRSKALGKSGFDALQDHLIRNDLPLPQVVIFTNKDGYKKRPFVHQINRFTHAYNNLSDFVLQEALLYRDLGIQFFHPLNAEVFLPGHDPFLIQDELSWESQLSDASLFFFVDLLERLKFKPFYSKTDNFFNVLNLILENKSVLFHCTGGIHRTGMISMALRLIQGGSWIWEFPFPIVVFPGGKRVELYNHAQVEYYLHNSHRYRPENILAVQKAFIEDPRFPQLVAKYRDKLNSLKVESLAKMEHKH